MADASDTATFSLDAFWKTRNFKTSARLHLQHHLFQNTIGYLLHPHIIEAWRSQNAVQKTVRVADLACGNAKWLCDLSKYTPSGTELQLHGFDVNPVNFPPKRYLPETVTIDTLDILTGEIPRELIGSFDVVHIRAFASLVTNNNPGVVLEHATKLLKPGGWLQWEETPPDRLVAESPDASTSKSTCDMVIQILAQGAKTQNLAYGWVHELDSYFRKAQLEATELIHLDCKADDMKAWTENYLLVWEDITQMLPSKASAPEAPLTREMWQSLFLKSVEETESGVALHQQKVVLALGRKPL